MKLSRLTSVTLALLLCATVTTTRADGLGTLFTTEQERALLDQAPATSDSPEDHPELTGQAASRNLKLSGILRSSQGRKQIWVNGENIDEHRKNDDSSMRLSGKDKVHVRNGEGMAESVLRPGQVLNRADGKVYESFLMPGTTGADKARD